ncbi:unnamed protein product [Medioppia subpectinata]|uniref:RNA methyltransferase n=1 Tax=Medioppia subpectinata TaxID=1979941 RepID=A0A7R9KT85_9ACAR|nr:unnamed protein product [Medioppia subpectinata]CAG2108177.1 unnamed protein product [Medioppia subpectinata]
MASGGVTFVTPPHDTPFEVPKTSTKANMRSKDNQKLKALNELPNECIKRCLTVSYGKSNEPPLGRKRSDSNNYRKRRHSFGANADQKFLNQKRRKDRIILPTKFLLGGNICDPLNLSSLANGANQVTPQSSPLPTPKHKTQVEVLIPANINDPLNLNSSGDIDESAIISPKMKTKSRKRKRKRTDSETTAEPTVVESEDTVKDTTTEPKIKVETTPKLAKLRINDNLKTIDKIVSPVIPQGIGSKHRRFADINSKAVLNLESFADNNETKVKPIIKNKNKCKSKTPHFRAKDESFRYGNYNRYYGYRNANQFDSRLECLKREWFQNKDILDIGCNVGHITLAIAKNFEPKKIIGLDIDNSLIRIANKNIRHYITSSVLRTQDFPISLPLFHGPLASTAAHDSSDDKQCFPQNVCFITGNYVSECDEPSSIQKQQFDTIVCLSLTKWVHLNWGDNGVKTLFKRIFSQLRPNGKLVLEAQPFCSYKKKKKINETIHKNFNAIKFRPEQFNEYLLSREVGFSQSELIGTPENPSKGFRRPLYVFTKSGVCFEKE